MSFILQPWQLLFVILADLVNRRQQQVNEFQRVQIEVLLEKLGKKRVLLNDDQRRRLAVKGKALGRKASIDFTTIEVWTKGGLITHYLLFVMEVATRRVHFAGCTANLSGRWMKQIARNLTDAIDEFLLGKRYLITDRDTKFSDAFRKILEEEGVESVRLPPRSANLNPHLERFMRSVMGEALERMIFFGETMLRHAICDYLAHYHEERNHQGVGNKVLVPRAEVGKADGEIACRERLGGLLRYYHRQAA